MDKKTKRDAQQSKNICIFSLFYKEVKKFDSTIQDRIVGPARFMINLLHEIYLYGQDCDNVSFFFIKCTSK